MAERLKLTVFWYRPHYFGHVNAPVVSIRTTCFTEQKQWGLYQNKVTSSFAANQRPGHWADNCKMVYWEFACSHERARTIREELEWNFYLNWQTLSPQGTRLMLSISFYQNCGLFSSVVFPFSGRRLRSAVWNIQGSAHARHQWFSANVSNIWSEQVFQNQCSRDHKLQLRSKWDTIQCCSCLWQWFI